MNSKGICLPQWEDEKGEYEIQHSTSIIRYDMRKGYPSTIILLGRSGSGKDTQAKLLAKKLKFKTFYTGDSLRKLVKTPTFLGKLLHQELQKGHLAPTWLASFLWIKTLVQLKPNQGIIFNGSPRKLLEAKLLNEVLFWLGRGIPRVVLVGVSEKEATARLTKRRICQKCGTIVPYIGEFKLWEDCKRCKGRLKARPDDTPKAIKTRFSWFRKEVGPVIRYYKQGRVLKVVNGEQSIEKVFQDILKVIK